MSKGMNTPIFIVGTPRSGTTLAANILGRHSRIFMPGETHFFDDIYARRKELGMPQDREAMRRIIARLFTLYQRYNEPSDHARVEKLFADPTVLNDLRTTCTSYGDVLSFFMTVQMSHAQKLRWGNNVPKDIFNIREIVSFYPDAKILVCVRDVRDFLLSYQNKWKVTSPENVNRIKKLYHPILTSLLWQSSVKQIKSMQSFVSPKNLMVVRYESIVHNPEVIVREICRFIEEDFEEKLLQVERHNSSFETQELGIFSSSVGRWRKQLSPEEVYLAQKITSTGLQDLGYVLEEVKVSPLRLACIVATFPYCAWRALDANAENRGPLMSYLSRRVVAFRR